ncbi:MAG: carbohydrate ABC transporter permease [Clostridia bacterium]|nr:carbohydrate ABC transporter permease [Clostridia bacterium]
MKRFFKQSKADIAFDIVNYSILAVLLVIFVIPLWFVLIASISSPEALYQGKVLLLPKGITFSGYARILQQEEIWLGYRNSVFYTIAGTLISLFFTFSAAYPLSRKDFKARNIIMGFYLVTMFFNGGIIATYLLVKSLGMLDTVWALFLPTAVSVYNIIVTRTFFQNSIPHDLFEAASLDGATNMTYITKVVLPLSKPIIAVMALFYGVGKWNEFFNALLYIQDRAKMPLQIFLREFLLQSQMSADMVGVDARWAAEQQQTAEVIKYGIIVVASLPVLIMYPFVQKHFVKGIMIGSVKG